MIEGILAGGAVAPLVLLVVADLALLASTTDLRSRLPAVPAPASPVSHPEARLDRYRP